MSSLDDACLRFAQAFRDVLQVAVREAIGEGIDTPGLRQDVDRLKTAMTNTSDRLCRKLDRVSAEWCNGSTAGSEPVSPGSNPGPATKTTEYRLVTVGMGIGEVRVSVPPRADGLAIKRAAKSAGLGVELWHQLQGHNANGSNSIIGDRDIPWQNDFTVIEIADNA